MRVSRFSFFNLYTDQVRMQIYRQIILKNRERLKLKLLRDNRQLYCRRVVQITPKKTNFHKPVIVVCIF